MVDWDRGLSLPADFGLDSPGLQPPLTPSSASPLRGNGVGILVAPRWDGSRDGVAAEMDRAGRFKFRFRFKLKYTLARGWGVAALVPFSLI